MLKFAVALTAASVASTTLASNVMFLLTPLITKLPEIFKSASVAPGFTSVTVKVASGNLSTAKESSDFNCQSNLPLNSPSKSVDPIVVISNTTFAPVNLPLSTLTVPDLIATVPVCLPVTFVPVHTTLDAVVSTV